MGALKKPLEDIVKKILEEASKTGKLTKEEMMTLLLYERESKENKSKLDKIISGSTKIVEAIDAILGGIL